MRELEGLVSLWKSLAEERSRRANQEEKPYNKGMFRGIAVAYQLCAEKLEEVLKSSFSLEKEKLEGEGEVEGRLGENSGAFIGAFTEEEKLYIGRRLFSCMPYEEAELVLDGVTTVPVWLRKEVIELREERGEG